VAGLHVDEAGVLVGGRAECLAEDLEVIDPEGELAVAGAQRSAVDTEQVAEVERLKLLETLGTEDVGAGVELDLARAVNEVKERRLAGATAGGEPTGDTVGIVGLLPHLKMLVGSADISDGLDTCVGVGRDVGAGLA
jgi:hypothetical protein